MEGKSVSWLRDEAANRYCKKFGSKPYLTVCLKSGAMLDNDDPLVIFESESEVLCNVDSWHVVSSEERYRTCCESDGVAPLQSLIDKLKISDSSRTFNFGEIIVETPQSLSILLRTMNGHVNLQSLSFEQTILCGKDWDLLKRALQAMSKLRELNLASSGLMSEHLTMLVRGFKEAKEDPQVSDTICKSLRSLNLSNNYLGDAALDSLTSILEDLTDLRVLVLQGIGLTNTNTQFHAALNCSSLKEFDISSNLLGDSVLMPLLSSLKSVVALNVSSVTCSSTAVISEDYGLTQGLMKLSTNHNSSMERLDISLNHIPKSFTFDLIIAISEAKKLSSLSLAHVSNLNDDSLIHLLRKCPTKFRSLDLRGVKLSKPMKIELIDLLLELFQTDIDNIRFSHIESIDSDTLVSNWLSVKGDLALVNGPVGHHNLLSLSLK